MVKTCKPRRHKCVPTFVSVLQSKKEIAKALRVFVLSENYPVLVHCIHGKDRTGLIVMIIMLLCSVEPEVWPAAVLLSGNAGIFNSCTALQRSDCYHAALPRVAICHSHAQHRILTSCCHAQTGLLSRSNEHQVQICCGCWLLQLVELCSRVTPVFTHCHCCSLISCTSEQ